MPSGDSRRTRNTQRGGLALTATLLGGLLSAGIATGEGGVSAPAPPSPKDVRCVERCLDSRVVTETGKAEVSGRSLAEVEAVKLRGESRRLTVNRVSAGNKRVRFKVPRGAVSGKPVLIDEYGNKVRSPVRLGVRDEDRLEESEGFAVRQADASPRKSYFSGKRKSTIDYLFEAKQPTDIRIDVLKGKKRRLVDTMIKRNQEPYANHRARWNGLTDKGKVAPNGKYRFEVSQLAGGEAKRAKFRFYDHRFPVGGPHTYGDGLGAGRGHQGQDVFAACGKPIYAARGGRVEVSAYQGSAGYYVVIDGRKTGRDYAYMHMSRKGRVKKGERVRTGERIGWNDETGNASGCHLHFEIWSAPGWYQGGSPISPTKLLKRWDRWS